MSLTYQDALELKEAGFISKNTIIYPDSKTGDEQLPNPSLQELIEACGGSFRSLFHFPDEELSDYRWTATSYIPKHAETGSSPIQAVKNLYCALKKK